MEKDGQLIGQNVFVKAVIQADDGRKIPIMTMGPICITPELKRRGYGKNIIRCSPLKKQKNLAVGHFVLREILISMGKADFDLPVNLVFGIAGWEKMRMHRSFCVKN